jgi:hypothetical protein
MTGKNIGRLCTVYGQMIGYPELKRHDLRHGVAMEVLEQHHDREPCSATRASTRRSRAASQSPVDARRTLSSSDRISTAKCRSSSSAVASGFLRVSRRTVAILPLRGLSPTQG